MGSKTVVLDREASHHALNVFRVRMGEPVEVRDGRGGCWKAEVSGVARGAVEIRLVEPVAPASESPIVITLAMALVKSDRMDTVIRQGTELGVSGFVAFPTEHSQYRLSDEQVKKRVERWRRITTEALCQCRRTVLPKIRLYESVSEFLCSDFDHGEANGPPPVNMIALEKGSHPGMMAIWERFPACRRITVVVGPEGGWEHSEANRFIEAGFFGVHLGPRILRFETAAVALAFSAQLLWGDAG